MRSRPTTGGGTRAKFEGRHTLRHIARFILCGLYTGSRAGTIASASTVRAPGKSFVDLAAGVFYRLPIGKKETNKRQPPAPIPPGLLSHMRRWHKGNLAREAAGETTDHHLVEWNGRPVASVKKGFATAVELAGIKRVITPHTLRHTAATWLMQLGVDPMEACGYLGMTLEVLQRTYLHHHPDHLKGARDAFGVGRRAERARVRGRLVA